MRRRFLGLEIGNRAVSAIVLEGGVKSYAVAAAARAAFPENTEGARGLVQALEEATAGINVKGLPCAVSIPAFGVSFRNVSLPFKNKKKISQVLPFELEPTLPLPIQDLYIDYALIKSAEPAEHASLVAAAVEKSLLKGFMEALSAVNIEPEIIVPGTYATALCLSGHPRVPQKWVLADLDTGSLTIVIGQSRQVCQVRSLRIPANPAGALDAMEVNIRQTLAAYQADTGEEFEPQALWVSGNGGSGGDGAEAGAAESGPGLQRLDLTSDSLFAVKTSAKTAWQAAQMNNALALALMVRQGLDGINFYKSAYARESFFLAHKTKLIGTAILAMIAVALMGLNVHLETRSLEARLVKLDRQMSRIFKATLPEVEKIVDPLQQMRVKLDEIRESGRLPVQSQERRRVIDLLNEISKRTPQTIEVTITRMVLGTENILIDGETDNFNSVDDIKGRLEQIEDFEKVTITAANLNKAGTRVRFKLKIQMG